MMSKWSHRPGKHTALRHTVLVLTLNKVYVSNLGSSSGKKKLWKVFKEFGEIVHIDNNGNMNKTQATVLFKNKEDARKSLKLDGKLEDYSFRL